MTHARRPVCGGFSLIELLVCVGIMAALIALLLPTLTSSRRAARDVLCKSNLRNFAIADSAYSVTYGKLPPIDTFVPSSIQVSRLKQIGDYFGLDVPPGPASAWPKRNKQPKWVNCPHAVRSGKAEGMTLGGGLYTGYVYVGGIDDSNMVKTGMATITHPGYAAPLENEWRGVMWADILTEFITPDPRRFEAFHVKDGQSTYSDFRWHTGEIKGINRAWSDGSVEWVPGDDLKLTGVGSPNLQVRHALGNFYY